MDTSLLSQMNYYRPKLKLDMERLLQLMGEKRNKKGHRKAAQKNYSINL